MYACVRARTRASSSTESRVRRAGGGKIYVRLHGVYHKLAIVINVLSSCVTDVRFEKRGGQDGALLTVLYAGTCLHLHYARKTCTRHGRLFDIPQRSRSFTTVKQANRRGDERRNDSFLQNIFCMIHVYGYIWFKIMWDPYFSVL